MANVDVKSGLVPIKRLDGKPFTVLQGFVPASDTTPIGVGDPLVFNGTSNTTEIHALIIGSLPGLVRATAGSGSLFTGVCIGVELDTQDSLTYRAGSTQRILNFIPEDGENVYEIQSNGTAAAASVGSNADIIFTSTPNTITGDSQAELNESSVNTTATLQLKIIGFVPSPDNAPGDNGKYLVTVNTAGLAPATAGV